MGLVGKVAGKVLGPRPGLAIVSFWGGRIEIILRILALLLGSLPALISAAIVLGTFEGIDEISDEWRDKIYAATGVVIAVAGLAIIIEILIIILRFLNIGVINLKIKIFLIIDIILSFVLAGGHIAGGVLQAYYGDEVPESIDNAKTIKQTMTCACASPLVHNHSATATAHNPHSLNDSVQHDVMSDGEESPETSLKPFPDDAQFPKNSAGSLFFADCLSSRNKYRDDRV